MRRHAGIDGQALACTRPGGTIGYVGVPHGVTLDGQQLFFGQKACSAGRRPCGASCPISWTAS